MNQENPETENKIPSIQSAYELLGVDNGFDLNKRYVEEDQKIAKSGQWDYDNPGLITNKIKNILEQMDPSGLAEEEQEWREEILWFWYHHAISCAIWKKQDKVAAQEYAAKALEHQLISQPDAEKRNQITTLFSLLLNDKIEEAKEWAKNINDEVEEETAKDIIKEWPTLKFKE